MKRRIIRAIFIGLLTICVVAWIGSYWRGFFVVRQSDKQYSLTIECGRVLTGCWNLSASPLVWNADFYDPKGWSDWDAHMGNRFLGFTFNGPSPVYDSTFSITIPLWFISLVAALLLWYVWRKTRPTIPPEKAFPVQDLPAPGSTPGPHPNAPPPSHVTT